jgi:hypothetical protein
MASNNAGFASGAVVDGQAMRRRNVPSSSPSVGLVNRVEVDDKKTQIKEVSAFLNSQLKNPLKQGMRLMNASSRLNQQSYKSSMNGNSLLLQLCLQR